ncbi:hypothetical protein ACJJTC_006570 [Scirpophaga incertulas]
MNYISIPSEISTDTFWQNINILLTKFNVVNKRLWGSNIIHKCTCKPLRRDWLAPMIDLRKYSNKDLQQYLSIILDLLDLGSTNESESFVELLLLELTPKRFTELKAYQLACLDKSNVTTTFYNVSLELTNLCPNFTYSFALTNGKIVMCSVSDSNSKPQKWLEKVVLPQLSKWCNEIKPSFQICKESLSLIPKEKYYIKYNEMKLKYGKYMVENWAEGTDPSKYVYEDVAIATYLLMLWEDSQMPEPKKFIDLGCGNGLLVYILTKEGHDGIGIDVRKRKIWDTYSNDVKLEEKTIIPSNNYLFPDADWLIGNHSDELTPWIPVMALRSSYKCNFFVLPCCAYNFDGSKYRRKDSSKSQYIEYIEYIKMVCERCGFEPKIDRLKIPSTKRICLVGQTKSYLPEKHSFVCDDINSLINETGPVAQNNETSWIANFKPREATERVRNCTQISQTVTQSVIDSISYYLLEGCDFNSNWSAGKVVHINELVSLISEENLKTMKSECGGLQTLIKNNHHIFKVYKGMVQLRYPRTEAEVLNMNYNNKKIKNKVKIKPCWFYNKHPQGCPLTDETCSYLHKNN